MAFIREEFLTELRDRTDIVDLISNYVELKKHGRLSKGCCPFHSEKTPSFTVYEDTQSYYCFGCQKGGDAITFIRDIENLDYVESVKYLAERAGLNMPEDNYDDTLAKKKQRMIYMNKEAARFYHNYMMSPAGKAGLDYWLSRGLSMSTIRHFGLGYAPDDWRMLLNHMRELGYSESELHEADLAKRSEKNGNVNYYDNFRNRAMVPIIDLRGNVLAFGGRVLDDSKPKYVNTADTLIYKKSLQVFALNFAKSSGEKRLILCEGYMDVIALHQAGFTNAVAGLGTALTDEQVRLISRYADEVILSYDADEAGQNALKKAMDKFQYTDLEVRALSLTGGKDPDEIIRKFGAERFKSIVDGAANEVEYKLLEAKKGLDLSSDDGRVKYMRQVVPILADIRNAIERDVYTSRISEETGVTKDAIVLQIKDVSARRNRQNQRVDFGKLPVDLKKQTQTKVEKAEETIIASLQNNPDFLKKIDESIRPEDFKSELMRHVYEVLISRLKAGLPADLIYLSSEFTPEEMGHIVRIQTNGQVISNTLSEVMDCIKVMKEDQTKGAVNPSELSNEEFLKLFKQ